MEVSVRIRVHVETSVKGVRTSNSTVEVITGAVELSALETDLLQEVVLRRSDALVAELDKRYPKQGE